MIALTAPFLCRLSVADRTPNFYRRRRHVHVAHAEASQRMDDGVHDRRRRRRGAAFTAALVPLGLLVWGGFNDGLGANPVETITFQTGRWTLRFLLITLAVTPLRQVTGWNGVIRLRRMLGLFAFFYLCLHFTTYVWLDQYFSIPDIFEDIVERPFITMGFTALVLLVPLALTSTNAMVKRLGGKNWRRLHRLAYAATGAGVVHFIWLIKADLQRPLIYLTIFTALMVLRLPPVVRLIQSMRTNSWIRKTSPTTRSSYSESR